MSDVLSSKYVGESVVVSFDFTDVLLGETISSVDSVVVTVVNGEDATPSALLDGDPTISGAFVLQPVTAGVAGVDYRLVCTITTSGNRVLLLDAILPVVALPPSLTSTYLPSQRWTEKGCTYELEMLEAPKEEPLTIPEAKRWCRITDDTEDEDVASLIAAARKQAEHIQGRQLMTATWKLTVNRFVSPIRLFISPVQSITSIEYIDTNGDSQVLDEDQYVFNRTHIIPAQDVTWPDTNAFPGAVSVEFVAGYGTRQDVPEDTKLWMRTYIATAYRYREEIEAGNISRLEHVNRMLDSERTYA